VVAQTPDMQKEAIEVFGLEGKN